MAGSYRVYTSAPSVKSRKNSPGQSFIYSFAPVLSETTPAEPMEIQNIVLKKGEEIKYRVTDKEGNPVKQAVFQYIIEIDNIEFIDSSFYEKPPLMQKQTDDEGYLYFFKEAPYTIRGTVFKTGYQNKAVWLTSEKSENISLKEVKTYRTRLMDKKQVNPWLHM